MGERLAQIRLACFTDSLLLMNLSPVAVFLLLESVLPDVTYRCVALAGGSAIKEQSS